MSRAAVATSPTLYVPRAQLEEWFIHALAGSQAMYARGPMLDAKHEVPVMIRDWIATGEVRPKQMRDQVSRELVYFIERCRPEPRGTRGERGKDRVTVADDWRETAEGRIFLHLVRVANLGLPCPSNAELADVGGLRDADAARYVLYDKLVKAGRVEIKLSGAGRAFRRVRITETGRWTADEGVA